MRHLVIIFSMPFPFHEAKSDGQINGQSILIAYMEHNKSSLNLFVCSFFMFMYLANIIPKGWKVLLTLFRYVHLEHEMYLKPKKYETSR